jgi:hypothetical protein
MCKQQDLSHDPIVCRLNSVADNHVDLRAAVRLYEVILPLVRDADYPDITIQIALEEMHSCQDAGIPIISSIGLEVDPIACEKLFVELARVVEDLSVPEKDSLWKLWHWAPDFSNTKNQAECRILSANAARIRMAVEGRHLELNTVLGCVINGDSQELEKLAEKYELDSGLLSLLGKNVLKPALSGYRKEICRKLTPLHWDKGYCFVCGSIPIFGELQDNEQSKHLRCDQCGADWHFNRLECLYCGNMDDNSQHMYYEEGCGSPRIDACDVCRGYIKIIASFTPTPPELLLVEDLATLNLDFIAQQRGYARQGAPLLGK